MRQAEQRSGVGGAIQRTLRFPAGGSGLEGDLVVPSGAVGLVLFAHGAGSSRFSSRNRYVAGELQRAGLGTLLADLLTPEEESVDNLTAGFRFDIDLLISRMTDIVTRVAAMPELRGLPIGLFGASTGAAGALGAAAARPDLVAAVVSRGGRPDLAGPVLPKVIAPTLLIVGERDEPVVGWNDDSRRRLGGPGELVVVPGATHLFEEPGALAEVARLATRWFTRWLPREFVSEAPGTR